MPNLKLSEIRGWKRLPDAKDLENSLIPREVEQYQAPDRIVQIDKKTNECRVGTKGTDGRVTWGSWLPTDP